MFESTFITVNEWISSGPLLAAAGCFLWVALGMLGDMEFDYVVTLCDNAREACPYFPAGTGVLHRGFEDPPVLAENAADEEEAMAHYRRVRDQIKTFVENLPES